VKIGKAITVFDTPFCGYNLLKRIGYPYRGIEEQVMGATMRNNEPITLFSGDYCGYCRRVSRELERLGLDYEAVNADADGREEVLRLSGQRAIPILAIGDEVIVDSSRIIRELRKRYAA